MPHAAHVLSTGAAVHSIDSCSYSSRLGDWAAPVGRGLQDVVHLARGQALPRVHRLAARDQRRHLLWALPRAPARAPDATMKGSP